MDDTANETGHGRKNFNKTDRTVLCKLVQKHIDVLNTAGRDPFTRKRKMLLWESIAEEFNANESVSGHRCAEQLQKRWNSISTSQKSAVKKRKEEMSGSLDQKDDAFCGNEITCQVKVKAEKVDVATQTIPDELPFSKSIDPQNGLVLVEEQHVATIGPVAECLPQPKVKQADEQEWVERDIKSRILHWEEMYIMEKIRVTKLKAEHMRHKCSEALRNFDASAAASAEMISD
jgi:Myb/SANT-like DNA-binding domain